MASRAKGGARAQLRQLLPFVDVFMLLFGLLLILAVQGSQAEAARERARDVAAVIKAASRAERKSLLQSLETKREFVVVWVEAKGNLRVRGERLQSAALCKRFPRLAAEGARVTLLLDPARALVQ